MPELDTNAKWIIGTVLGAAVGVAAVVVTAIGIMLGGLHNRIDDVNHRLDDFRADVQADFAAMRADVRADFADVRADLADLRAVVRAQDTRLRAVEIAFGKVDQRLETFARILLAPAPEPSE